MPQDIKSIFIKVNTKEEFEELLQSGSVRDTLIAFILDTKQIWTHNTYFSCPYSAEEINENEYVIALALNDLKSDLTDIADNKTDKISSSTDNAVIRFDGTSGDIQNSGVTINDNNQLTAAKLITSGGTSSQFVKGDGSLDSNTYAGAQISGGAANKAVSIPFGQVDSTSTSTAFTATVDGITELRDGVCVYLKNGVVTSAASCTLNVNGLGAKPMYNTMAATTAITTQWGINYTMLFIYNSTRVSGGCWDMFYGYYSDTNSVGYQLRTNSYTLPVSDTNRFYKIFFTSADNTKWVPASADTTNNATSAKPVNQRPINPFGPIVYVNSSTNFTAGTNVTVNVIYQQIPLALGYSFNRTGAALTLTIGKPVFIKCAPQDDGSAIIDANTPYVQDLPTSEDGMIYIFLGVAYSATAVELQMVHPVYYYKNGSINLWTGTGVQTDVSKSTESNVIDVGNYDLMKINEVKGKSLVMNQHSKVDYTDSYTTAWSGDTYYNGTTHRDKVDTTHKYFVRVRLSAESVEEGSLSMKPYLYGNDAFVITINTTTKYAETKRIVQPSNTGAYHYITGTSFRGTNVRKQLEHIDLTQMFGAGNEPTTVEEVEAILGNGYNEYNTGEVVGNNVEKLDVYDINNTKKGSLPLNLTELTGKVRGEWNQRAKNPNPSTTNNTEWRAYNNSNVSIEYVDDGVKATILNEGYGYSRGIAVNCTGITNTHKYFAIITVKPSVTHDFNFETGNGQAVVSSCTANQWNKVAGIVTASRDEAQILIVKPATSNLSVNETFTVRFASCIDLTQMFGAGNEPTSVEQCLMMFPNEYYPYNAGEVNSDDISGIIYPDGLHGVGTAYDSLIVDEDGYARRAVKRMGSVDLGSLSWSIDSSYSITRFVVASNSRFTTSGVWNKCICDRYSLPTNDTGSQQGDKTIKINSVYCIIARDDSYSTAADFKTAMDGVMLYYELATPIEYVLDTPVQCVVPVSKNGTVKQVPVMPDSTPMVMDVTYLRDNALYATKEYVNDAIADKADSATTLAGYGITDAKIENGVITLGSNTITPITSHQDISGKADIASPSFTGIPTAPTASTGTNTTQIATTAFVQGEISNNVSKEELLPEAIDYSKQYLRTTALESGTIGFYIWNDVGTDMITSISYSTNNGKNWVTIANQNDKQEDLVISINVSEGDKILWKGIANYFGNYEDDWGCFFFSTARFDVDGNIMSLCYGDNFVGQTTLNYDGQFAYLFYDVTAKHLTNVVSAKNLILTATTLSKGCYSRMFSQCASLTTAPVLPATTLAESCYASMFYKCTSLTTASVLPATTLADDCYNYMFYKCTSLTTAPILPATTLADGCYRYMFDGCSNLNSIKAMFTTTPSTTYTSAWVYDVAATGTFIKNDSATWTTTGANAVPIGWTVRTESEMEHVTKGELDDVVGDIETLLASI